MKIIKELKKLKKDAVSGSITNTCAGICHFVKYEIKIRYIESWKYYSGQTDFPVFDPENKLYKRPSHQYGGIRNLWEGRQLELRLSLIDHLIKCYESEYAKCQTN